MYLGLNQNYLYDIYLITDIAQCLEIHLCAYIADILNTNYHPGSYQPALRLMVTVAGRGPVLALQWCDNGCDGVSNHQPHDCLLNRSFRHRSKKTSKLSVTGFWARNSPVTGEFPAQRASNAENVSSWWRHHGFVCSWPKVTSHRQPRCMKIDPGTSITERVNSTGTKFRTWISNYSVNYGI